MPMPGHDDSGIPCPLAGSMYDPRNREEAYAKEVHGLSKRLYQFSQHPKLLKAYDETMLLLVQTVLGYRETVGPRFEMPDGASAPIQLRKKP